MWNLRDKINKQNKNKLTDTENKLMAARWEGDMGWWKKGERIKMYRLPDIKTVVGM